jgi:hypothetical protein
MLKIQQLSNWIKSKKITVNISKTINRIFKAQRETNIIENKVFLDNKEMGKPELPEIIFETHKSLGSYLDVMLFI